MTDRDSLIKLLNEANQKGSVIVIEDTADYLLANGVIVLPCQKGTVLNRNGEKCIANHWNVVLTAFNEENHVRLFDVKEAEKALVTDINVDGKKEREGK